MGAKYRAQILQQRTNQDLATEIVRMHALAVVSIILVPRYQMMQKPLHSLKP